MTDEPKHQLHEVAPGCTLHIPERFNWKRGLWLRAGGVVDLADPFIADVVQGQAYKLQPITEARPADPLPTVIANARAKFVGTYVPPLTNAEKAKATGDERASGVSGEIEKPDVPTKHKKGAASAS